MSFIGTCGESISQGIKDLIIGVMPSINTNYNIFIREEGNGGQVFHQVAQSDGAGLLTAKISNLPLLAPNEYTVWCTLVSSDPDYYAFEDITINSLAVQSVKFGVCKFKKTSSEAFQPTSFQLSLCLPHETDQHTTRAYLSANQSIPNNVQTKIQFDTEDWDDQAEYDNVTNYRFTPKSAGKYLVVVSVHFVNNSTGKRNIYITKNGVVHSLQQKEPNAGAYGSTFNISDILDMNGSTDYIEVEILQDSGGALSIVGNTDRTYLSIHKIK